MCQLRCMSKPREFPSDFRTSRCQRHKRHSKLRKFTERIVKVPVVHKEQIPQPDKGCEDPKVQTKMFRTSKLQKIVKVLQVQVIDEVAKVPRSMRRQVSMTQDETERGRIRSPRRCRSVSVLTSRAGRTKPKCKQKCRQRTEIHEEQSRKAAEKVMPDVR